MTFDKTNNHEIIYYGKKVYDVNLELCKKIESDRLKSILLQEDNKETMTPNTLH